MADLIVLLASERAGNVTASDFVIDGGLITALCTLGSDCGRRIGLRGTITTAGSRSEPYTEGSTVRPRR